MQLRDGTPVFTSDGRRVGEVAGLVFDPVSEKASSLLVDTRRIGREERLVPLHALGSTDEERVRLADGWGPDDLTPLEETKYVPLPDEDRAALPPGPRRILVWHSPYDTRPSFMGPAPLPEAVGITERNTPAGEVTVHTGDKVVSKEGTRLGKVGALLTRGETVTGFVVERGLFSKKQRRALPVAWARSMEASTVRLGVGAALVENVPPAR